MSVNEIFFELIRVALGTQETLSRSPSKAQWAELYAMAKKQSLVGICFAGLQKLYNFDYQEPNTNNPQPDSTHNQEPITKNLDEVQYLQWMGMAAKIQQRNETVNRQCAELGERLKVNGYRYAILKGQGVAALYRLHDNDTANAHDDDNLSINHKPKTINLQMLRQSGDIDVLLWKEGLSLKENRKAVMELACGLDSEASGSEHHVHAHIFSDTEVELHFEPSYFCNPLANRRFRRWCEEHREDMVWCEELGCMIPNAEYNVVFLLSHIFRHYVSEGVGMRQLMDYYFVLCNLNLNARSAGTDACQGKNLNDKLLRVLDSFNMKKFASAVMWVLAKVFVPEGFRVSSSMFQERWPWMICEPNERLGRKLLTHIMHGGNFGHHNEVKVVKSGAHWANFVNQLAHDLHLAIDYPSEALWSPLSMIREFLRIRI